MSEAWSGRPSSSALPAAVTSAARALGAPVASITPIGGRSGQSWSCGEHVLRTGEVEQLRREVAAMGAASSVVPVPEVLDVAEFADPEGRPCGALLLERMPGRPAGETPHLSAPQMRGLGETCGRLHARLAAATLSQQLPLVHLEGRTAIPGPPDGVLLHLDLHPLNVLVDDLGEVSGVIDWANAAGGPEVLDRARTWSILTFDPAAAPLRSTPRGAALVEGWATAAGWAELPAEALAWACTYMLDDFADRPATDDVQRARRRLERARTALRHAGPRPPR